MLQIQYCRFAGILGVVLAMLASGCNQEAKVQDSGPVVQQVVAQKPVPGEIELFDAKVCFVETNIVQFDVKYRFTQGQPDKYYMCNLSFPGTANGAKKTMMTWELKPEGIIRDKVQMREAGAKTFEIYMSETTSPQSGYKKNSNVVSGPIQ